MDVTFVFEPYGALTRARIDNKDLATTCRGSVRWHHTQIRQPGAIENFRSVYEANAAIQRWCAGLEIVPWDATGLPES